MTRQKIEVDDDERREGLKFWCNFLDVKGNGSSLDCLLFCDFLAKQIISLKKVQVGLGDLRERGKAVLGHLIGQ